MRRRSLFAALAALCGAGKAVAGPSAKPMALIGERGPEAILPLSRGMLCVDEVRRMEMREVCALPLAVPPPLVEPLVSVCVIVEREGASGDSGGERSPTGPIHPHAALHAEGAERIDLQIHLGAGVDVHPGTLKLLLDALAPLFPGCRQVVGIDLGRAQLGVGLFGKPGYRDGGHA